MCFLYVNGVRTTDQFSISSIADAAETDDVLAVSENDHNIQIIDCTSQSDAPWGLGFLDRHVAGSSGSYTFPYANIDGEGTVAYVIDTGLNHVHTEFAGRVKGCIDFTNGESNTCSDHSGHGTHVAGTIMGSTYGVAKRAQVFAMNVFGRSNGARSDHIISAVQRTVELSRANREKAVMNLSLGGPGVSSAMNGAINAAFANGVIAAISAGNSNADACGFSPASAERAVTVSAFDSSNRLAGFSNFGQCVDISAPGVQILSAWIGGRTRTASLSGTSMSSPHVAGVICQIMSRLDTSDPARITRTLLEDGSYFARNTIPNLPSRTPDKALQSPCQVGPVNECEVLDEPCLNGGTCIDRPNGYDCVCPGLIGDRCQGSCADDPCVNGGECTDLPNFGGFQCECREGYTGSTCLTRMTPPAGCTCVGETVPNFGRVDDYCNTWDDQPAFCFVDRSATGCPGRQQSPLVPGAWFVRCDVTDVVEEDECSVDSECGPEETCRNGFCVDIPIFNVIGDCDFSGDCVSSENYPSVHGNNADCTVTIVRGAAAFGTSPWDLEATFDHLLINGVDIERPEDVPAFLSSGSTMRWTSDSSVTKMGWEICFSLEEPKCTRDSECPSGEVCQNGECVDEDTFVPTGSPSLAPTGSPSLAPSLHPTAEPTVDPYDGYRKINNMTLCSDHSFLDITTVEDCRKALDALEVGRGSILEVTRENFPVGCSIRIATRGQCSIM